MTTQRGVERIDLRHDERLGPLVPLAPLVRAVGGSIEAVEPWIVWRSPSGRFRFLPGTPLIDDGNQIRTLPASVHTGGDTTWIPLAFVAEVLADPARKAWTWTASSATLAEGPPISPLVSRPAATTVGAEERSRLPAGLRAGHHVTIDAGHGGTDPGNPGMFFPNGLKEKDVTLAVSLLVRDELERRGVKVTMTRTTDTLIALGQRAPRYCRDRCDLFVSIHVNSLPRRPGFTTVRGFETYFQARGTRPPTPRAWPRWRTTPCATKWPTATARTQGLDFILKDLQANEYLRESARAAELIQSSLGEVETGGDRGVQAGELCGAQHRPTAGDPGRDRLQHQSRGCPPDDDQQRPARTRRCDRPGHRELSPRVRSQDRSDPGGLAMRRVLALLLLLTACGWSNALYNARRLSASAAKAERQDRSFDAGSLWGQVAVKAESAYVRNPDGGQAAEALWLRGRALAHLGDCVTAMPVLEHARVAGAGADWIDALRLELARCRAQGGDPEGAVAMLEPLLGSEDAELRSGAMQVAGRALVRAGRWGEALQMLAGDPDPDATWDRALALAHLGRVDSALAEVSPRIALADSSANWDELVRTVAAASPEAIDPLLTRLGTMRKVNDTIMARWRLAAAQGLLAADHGAADRYLEAVLETPTVPSASQARMLLTERRMATVADSASLQSVLDSLGPLNRGDGVAMIFAQDLARWGDAIQGDIRANPPGAATGDLAMFFDASIARDSLKARHLASWLFQRMEHGWPQSPYLAKGLLARIALEPDSAEAIRARLAAITDSPYLAFLQGQEGQRFTALEDSLRFYLDDRMAAVIAGSGPDAN